jgi:hypothetical protein
MGFDNAHGVTKRILVQRTIIDIFASGSSHTSTRTPRRYWKIFWAAVDAMKEQIGWQ